MNYMHAIRLLAAGTKVRRKVWRPGRHLRREPSPELVVTIGRADAHRLPWDPIISDIKADDWEPLQPVTQPQAP
jgi:hypothetical protein